MLSFKMDTEDEFEILHSESEIIELLSKCVTKSGYYIFDKQKCTCDEYKINENDIPYICLSSLYISLTKFKSFEKRKVTMNKLFNREFKNVKYFNFWENDERIVFRVEFE